MDSQTHKQLTPVQHPQGTKFLAIPSFGFSLLIQECEVLAWAPSSQFVHLRFPLVDKSEWVAVSSFSVLEVLNENNKTGRSATKAPNKPGSAKRHSKS